MCGGGSWVFEVKPLYEKSWVAESPRNFGDVT